MKQKLEAMGARCLVAERNGEAMLLIDEHGRQPQEPPPVPDLARLAAMGKPGDMSQTRHLMDLPGGGSPCMEYPRSARSPSPIASHVA